MRDIKDIKSFVFSSAGNYFDKEKISSYLEEVSRWTPKVRSFFYQVIQSGNQVSAEFSAHAGEAIIDITMSLDRTTKTIIPVSNIIAIISTDTKDFTELLIRTEQVLGINYRAVVEESRAWLREYTQYIEGIVAERKG